MPYPKPVQDNWLNNYAPQWAQQYASMAEMTKLRSAMPGGKRYSDPTLYGQMHDQMSSYNQPILGVSDYAQALRNSGASLNDYFGMTMASQGSGAQARLQFAADQQRRSGEAFNQYAGMRQWDWQQRDRGRMATLAMMQSDSLGRMAIQQQGRAQGKAPSGMQSLLNNALGMGSTILGTYLGGKMGGTPDQTR